MFVPSKLLLWIVALGLSPLALVAGLMGVPLELLSLGALAVGLVVAMDAVLSLQRLRGVQVVLPERVRCSKGKRLDLAISVQDTAHQLRQLRLGLPFPAELEPDGAELEVPLPAAGGQTTVHWRVLAVERGAYQLSRAYVQAASKFKLWDMRHSVPCQCELRIYPDLSREKHALAPLFFRRGAMGLHQVRQLGRGREFEQLRSYLPGDNYSDVYWKGTAKRQYPVTMMYQVERTQEVHVLVDISRRSARPLDNPGAALSGEADRFAPKTQCERFLQAAMVLALSADQQGDRFGLMTFSDQVHTILPAGGGRGHYNAVRDTLYTLEPRVVSPDFQELFIQVGNRIRQRSLLILLTDLGEPWLSESFREAVQSAARKHVILVHTLGSKELQPLFHRGDSIQHVDQLYSRLAGHLLWSDLNDTTRELKQCGIHLTSSLQESLIADSVSGYLNVKKRQLI